ncbi:hypothetical protein B0J11DRAFT_543144 [Dendryphion nanum]|uniref:BHLH domain-containing protein n=1 Tax=Dendryphion nanum TaxID=256645 RepID=A0A9P9D1Q2_9PLEO|nr:hypothetical protein B0J11DRAFT_543144 [Dendryphion nanum]
MDVDLSVYPRVTGTDCSPTNESFSWQNSFGQNYLVDLYATSLDQSLDYHPAFYSAPAFGELEQKFTSNFDTAFTFDQSIPITPTTPTTGISSTSPFCIPTSATPSLSPSSPERETPSEAILGEEPIPKRLWRKRGRPTLDCKLSDVAPVPSIDTPPKHRLRTLHVPHNQVECKYREGLNSEMERLRRAVPTLLRNEDGTDMGRSKPSKATVLSCAIQYIEEIENERDVLRERNEQLSGTMWRKVSAGESAKLRDGGRIRP